MKTAYISHPAVLLHQMSDNHPECPARITAIENELRSTGVMESLHIHDAFKATIEQLNKAHANAFIKEIIEKAPTSGIRQLDPDTAMNPFTLEAALHSAGAGILATDLVMSGQTKRAFCNVRPPGHHAEYDKVMGFCFFNNIAVAAMHALEEHQLQRVAIVDFDVHHGNGTEDILSQESLSKVSMSQEPMSEQSMSEQSRTLFCSSYQHPYYPGFAGKSIKSKVVNVPLPSGTGSDAFQKAVTLQWLPELREFKPDIIFISAGFDGHAEDTMGGFNLLDNDYVWVTQEICKIANEFAQGRVVSMLEGGYDLESLARATAKHVRVLTEY